MAQTTLVWTALPDGFDAGRPRLAVYVQPRLTGTPGENTLASYPAFTSAASPWSQRVRQIPFQVWIDGQVRPAEAQFDAGTSDDLFRAIFPPSLPVRTFVVDDLRGRSIRSYPVGVVMDYLDAEYGKIAAEPPRVITQETAERPDKGSGAIRPPVLPAINDLGNASRIAVIDAALAARFTAPPNVRRPGTVTTGDPAERTAAATRAFTTADLDSVAQQTGATRETVAFRMLERYYTATAHEQAARRNAFAPAAPEVDVHTVHGGLGDTPVLLRRCGFAFHLLLPVGSLAGSGTVRVLPGAGAPGTQACPPTRYTATAERFRPAPRLGSTLVTRSGMLPLGGGTGGGTGGAFGGPLPVPAAPADSSGAALPAIPGGVFNGGGMNGGAMNAGIASLGPAYRVVQGDPDGTGLKATASARTRAAQGNETDDETLYETGLLASQRSAGLAVYRTDRGAHLAVAVQRTADFDAAVRSGFWTPTPPTPGPQAWPLFADDVVAGYVVEVFDETVGAWRSLCRREGRYAPDGLAPFLETDDGSVAVSAVALTPDADAEKLIRAHDALFQWDGWSLVAPRPGLVLVPDDAGEGADNHEDEVAGPPGRYERLARPKAKVAAHVHVRSAFKPAEGSLPRLRFGRRYRIRARAVDVAGNVAPPDDAHASPFVAFARMEPLEPPTLALRRALSEGESAGRLVIRSDPGAQTPGSPPPADTVQYAARPDVLAATQKTIYGQFLPTCERHILPPGTTPEMAERHGSFDTGPWTDPARRDALLNVLAKASGTLLDAAVVDVATGLKTIPQTGLALVASDGSTPAPLAGRVPGDPLPNGVYPVYETDRVVVPYLPDPLARGVAFQNVPGAAGTLVVPLDVSFPDAVPFRIRLAGAVAGTVRVPGLNGFGATQSAPMPPRRPAYRTLAQRPAPTVLTPIGTGPRVLDVALPPAAIVEILYSTVPKTPGDADSATTVRSSLPDKHDLFGARKQAVPYVSGTAALDRAVSGGIHEVVSPVRRLTLVHAVQRPLTPARFETLAAARPAETGHPAGAGQTRADLSGVVLYDFASTGRLDLEASWDEPVDDVVAPAPRDGVAGRPVDTRSGRVAEVDVEPFSPARQPPTGMAVTNGVARIPFEGFYVHRHELGDTKRRTVRYRADASTRFRDYFPSEITQTPANLMRTGPETVRTVPSSARPAAPDVRYVVPTFRWQTEPLANGILRRRCGGGLRVWLGRPWYSSGEGEQLAVLIGQGYDNSNSATAEAFDRYRTRWGLDPFWGGDALGEMPAEALLNQTAVRDNLSIPDNDRMRVFGVAHDVHFDTDRKLWYCDIELDTGAAYMPFVKLVVARFQPESVPETHLSSAVVTDFVQTMPTRTAAVRRVNLGTPREGLEVSVGGPMANSAVAAQQSEVPLNENNTRATAFTATVERQSQPGAAWTNAGLDTVVLAYESGDSLDTVIVRSVIPLPAPLRAAGTRLRVSVAEMEVHAADAPTGTAAVPGGRLVYADTLELP